MFGDDGCDANRTLPASSPTAVRPLEILHNVAAAARAAKDPQLS
jgi:hypothetical protein